MTGFSLETKSICVIRRPDIKVKLGYLALLTTDQ